jgi:transcriptional regulator with GAF, ATPase, and Fis domain
VNETIPPGFSRAAEAARTAPSRQEEFGDLSQAADDFGQALEYYRTALEALDSGDAEGRVRLLYKMAHCARRRGDLESALLHLKAAHRALRPLGDTIWQGRIAGRLSALYVDRGEYRRASRLAHIAYQHLRHSSEHVELGRADQFLGLARLRMGDYVGAREAFTSALATFRRIEFTEGMAMALNNLGLALKNLGQWGEAIRSLEQALRLNEKSGNYALVAAHALNLGILRFRLGEWDLAEEELLRARQIMGETNDFGGLTRVHLALGSLQRRRRDFESAQKAFLEASRLSTLHGFQRELVLSEEFMGELELDRGKLDEACRRLERTLAIARRRAPSGDLVTEVANRLGLALVLSDRRAEAQKAAEEARFSAQAQGDRCERAFAERTLGLVALLQGRDRQAQELLPGAQRVFEELGERYELARTFLLTVQLGFRREDPAIAVEPYAEGLKRAVALFRDLDVPRLAGESALWRARAYAASGQPDRALAEVEHAQKWLREAGEPGGEEQAAEVRGRIEAEYVASTLSTSNEFRALLDANQLFRDAGDLHAVLNSTVRLAVEHTGGDRGFVAFSASGGRLDVMATYNLGVERARGMLRSVERAGGRELLNGNPLFASRVAADRRFHADLAGHLNGVFSLVVVPLAFPSQSIGLVCVDRLNDNPRGAFNQRDLNRLAVLAQSAAIPLVEQQRSVLLAENTALKDQLKPSPGLERVVTQSPEMQEILQLLAKVGDSGATILLQGETGTGKGLLAQSIHEVSSRRDGPFVAVNCAALPENLLESELFGHQKGAFTGADREKPGLFRVADGGTVFLDEVEKINEPMQAKLLHVLDRAEIRPVGSTKVIHVNVRVVCATNVDLLARIREGRFLEDLYYRMNDITVTVPPLRDRREDIPLLTDHFLRLYARQMDKPVPELKREVRRVLLEHEWRGNVRELEKTIKRLVVLWDGEETAGLALLPPEMREPGAAAGEDEVEGLRLRSHVERVERRVIREALETSGWNKSQAARSLGISYPTLLSKIRLLQLDRRTRLGA